MAVFVQDILRQLMDDIEKKFLNSKRAQFTGKPITAGLPDMPPTKGIILPDCEAAVILTTPPYSLQLAVLTAPRIDVATFMQGTYDGTVLLVFDAGPFPATPLIWEKGKGYFIRDDIKIQSDGLNLSARLPAAELCGYMVARSHQLMKENTGILREGWEQSFWPHGDYEHRPAHLPPENPSTKG